MTKLLVDGVTMEAKREVVLTFPDKTTATISKNEKGGAIDVSISNGKTWKRNWNRGKYFPAKC